MALDRDSELFLRFRRTREPAPLAELFDRVAPDLLRIARHATGNTADAEDVVQATFVALIERADSWDERRGLFPWLVGILVRQNGLLRRARRVPDPARLPERGGDDPHRTAQGAELDDAVAAALQQLDATYRPVLHLHLRHGLNGKEIAAALGRPHARVRQQLLRGLQRLRGLLPAGFAVAVATAVGSGRGLAAVKQAVLASVPLSAVAIGTTTATTGASVWLLGGVCVAKKLSAVAALPVLAALLWWVAHPSDVAPSTTLVGVGPTAAVDARVDAATVPADPGGVGPLRVAVPTAPGALRLLTSNGIVQQQVAARAGNVPFRGLAGLPLELWAGESGSGPRAGPRVVRTGDDGEALVPDLEPGWWQVGLIAAERGPWAVLVESGRETTFALPLVIAGFARGQVVDPAGNPVAFAEILLSQAPRDLEHFSSARGERSPAPDLAQRRAARSDQAGRFVVYCADRETHVAAIAPGYSMSRPQPTWRGAAPEITLVLEAGSGVVVGTVFGADDRPLGDALVCLHATGNRPRWRRDGALLLPRLPMLSRTDSHGAFAFEYVPVGHYQLRAAAGTAMPAFAVAEVTAGGRVDADLRLQPGCTIRGLVRAGNGAPLAGLDVRVVRDAASPGYISAGRTDAAGSFELVHVPVKPFVLLVETGQLRLAERSFGPPVPGVLDCELVVPDGGLLRGRVVDHQGHGLCLAGGVDAIDARGSRIAAGVVREDGRFELLRLVPGACRVRAVAAEGSWADPDVVVEVAADTSEVELRVDEDRLGSVRGRLRAGGGLVLADAELFLVAQGRSNRRPAVHPAADGAFVFAPVPPGRFELLVHGGLRSRVGFELGRGQQLDLGDLVLEPWARLRIEFVHADGRPWQGALPDVDLRSIGAESRDPQVRLDAVAGALEGELPAGRWSIAVDAVDLIAERQLVVLRPDERTVVRLAVAIGRSREIVFGADGSIPLDATSIHVEVQDGSGHPVLLRSFRRSPHGDGAWTLHAKLPVGDYSVGAHTDGGLRFAGAFVVRDDPGDPERVLVPLVR